MDPVRKPSRLRRNLVILAIGLGLFTLIGFFVVPPIAKAQIEKRLSAELGRTVTIGRLHVNPYALSVTIEDFDVRLKEGDGSFVGWKRLYVNFDAWASLAGAWVLGGIELEDFHGAVVIKQDGSLNFADVLARLQPPSTASTAPAPAPGRPLRIRSLVVTGARLEFSDQSRPQPFATTVGPVTFALTEFQTTGAAGAPYHFDAVTEAQERVRWAGTLSADPLSSTGELHVENIALAKYAPYYAHQLGADIAAGQLSVHGRYEVNLKEGARVMKLLDGAVQLRGLKLLERATQAVAAELPSLDITGMHADALKPSAAIDAVRLTGGYVRVRREKDGALNWLALLAPPAPVGVPAVATAATVPAPSPSVAQPTPDVSVGELALQDFKIDLIDFAAPRPAQLALGGLQLSLKKITLADGAVMPLALSFNWAPQGAVKVAGTVSIKPELKAELTTEVAGLALLPLSPYLEQFVNARLTQGTVSTTGAVGVALTGGSPAITFEGGVTVEKFGLVDGVHNEELAGFGAFALKGLRVATAPQLNVVLEEVALAAPCARVLINADKTVNLALIAKASTPPAVVSGGEAKPVAAAAATPLPKITVGRVVISEGNFSLTDRSIEPHVQMAVTQFGGTIAGLSSENLAKADVDLKAAVDGAGPITITGKLDPLGAQRFADLTIDFKNVDLLPLSPYSGKYAGYELARGKLTLDVKTRLEGRRVESNNVVTLNQFTFGSPVTSPDATKLPVRLGVALLKDTSGRIVIDVPVSGDLDDPSFRIGKVVLRVIVNLLTKAAVSPFSLVGSMFGGGGDELAFQEFSPGGSELLPGEKAKLETMVKALTNRPALNLALEGGYDAPADSYALRQQKVAALVRTKIWEQRHATDPAIAPPDQLVITPEAHAAMVKQLFDEKFQPGTEFGAPLAQAPVAVAAPPVAKKGLFRRVVDVVTLKEWRGGASKPVTQPALAASVAAATPGTEPAGPSLEEMTGRLAETITVGDNDLRALGAARAQRVRDYFINEGKIAADRLFLAQGSTATKTNQGPRVFLSLQ